ncbi:MAG: glycosyltransferase [Fluviibacter phosphoraccumulans]
MHPLELADSAIVIVIFNTDPSEHAIRVAGIVSSGAQIFLVDNTPIKHSDNDPKIVFAGRSGVHYLRLGKNFGIAHALNVGIDAAFNAGFNYVFTFDQDSEISVELLNALITQYKILERTNTSLLALGPQPINKDTGVSYLRRRDRIRVFLRRKPTDRILPTSEIITSGMLVNKKTFSCVGPYDAKLFIDFVDHDWCWRLRRNGGICLVDLNTCLPHMVGNADVPFTFGMKQGAPFRLFFLFRNAIFLIVSGRMPFYDAVKFIALIPAKLFIFGLMPDRKERWRQMCRGFLKGFHMALRP